MRIAAAAIAVSLLAIASCGTNAQEETAPDGQEENEALPVLASFYPLQYVVEEVGGPAVEVTNLTPPGSEPHHLELAPATVQQVDDAPLVVYLSGLQPAVDDAIAATDPQRVVDAAEAADLLEADPHFWLDPLRLAAVGDQVAAALGQADPERAADFDDGAQRLRDTLEGIDADYAAELARCEGATLVSNHESYGYLADRYGLEQVGIAGIDPEAEPSPARVREIGQVIAAHNVGTVFYDEPTTAHFVKALAEEFDVNAVHLDPLEMQLDAERDYSDVMRANLETLTDGLNCDG